MYPALLKHLVEMVVCYTFYSPKAFSSICQFPSFGFLYAKLDEVP